MKTALAFLALLAGLTGGAQAQSLYGVTLGNVQAIRDTNENVSTITGSLANQSVSYTHLDVYKRQSPCSPTSWRPAMPPI